jgi:hypothetical protein
MEASMTNVGCAVRRLGCAALGLVLLGCGSSEYEFADVTGKVTCDGKPAWGGVVIFEPLDAPEKTGRPKGQPGRRSQGLVQKDGTFSLTYTPGGGGSEVDGAITGPHRVTFIQPQSTPWKWNPQDDWMEPAEKEKLKADLASRPVYPALSCGSTLAPGEVDVKAGDNTFEFTLNGEKPKPVRATNTGGSS